MDRDGVGTKKIIVSGQLEVCDLARILIEHRTPFSIKPMFGLDEIFAFEMTIPAGLGEGTYGFALASRQCDKDAT